MRSRTAFPLMAKMSLWLLLHFAVIGVAFAAFVKWQLSLGLDSLLSGATADRLRVLGNSVASEMRSATRDEWPDIVAGHVSPYDLEAVLLLPRGSAPAVGDVPVPTDVHELVRASERRPPSGPPPPPGGRPGASDSLGPPPPPGRPDDEIRDIGGPPAGASGRRHSVRPLFLKRSKEDGGYWAGIDLPLSSPGNRPQLRGTLLVRSDDSSAGGLFYDFKPWLLGGLAVLCLSLATWAPFFLGITRYLSSLSKATERIARGDFETRIAGSRRDELGDLGEAIDDMAGRLGRLVKGQKRFLGDVAHELCSPLARIRTGLGILEQGLDGPGKARLESIEEDVAELSHLVSEVLDFTKATTAPGAVELEQVRLRLLLVEELERECPGHQFELKVPEDLSVLADRRLLARAVANVLRNAHTHGGPDCVLRIQGGVSGQEVTLVIADGGPGVRADVLPRLFEPFYRPDEARNREAGGAGLGMAIVREAIEVCGGSVSARGADPHGLEIVMRLVRG